MFSLADREQDKQMQVCKRIKKNHGPAFLLSNLEASVIPHAIQTNSTVLQTADQSLEQEGPCMNKPRKTGRLNRIHIATKARRDFG